jgi:hypothetical protein
MSLSKWVLVLAAAGSVSGCLAVATVTPAEASPTTYREVAYYSDASYTTIVGEGGSNCSSYFIHLWWGVKTAYVVTTLVGDCE